MKLHDALNEVEKGQGLVYADAPGTDVVDKWQLGYQGTERQPTPTLYFMKNGHAVPAVEVGLDWSVRVCPVGMAGRQASDG